MRPAETNNSPAPPSGAGFGNKRADYTATPDRRYFVCRGRLWRLSNPQIDAQTHRRLVDELVAARRTAREGINFLELINARLKADAVKRALGERGDVWWNDGAPDYHRRMAVDTPYADWYSGER